MTIVQTNKLFKITLNPQQLWYLAKFFSPGWFFGTKNPYEDLSEEEIISFEKQASLELEKEGLIKIVTTNQIQVDEMLGGMVYSCIHSKDLLVLKVPGKKSERYYHFLPQWQLELFKSSNEYSLTLLRERSHLFPHLIDTFELPLKGKNEGKKFSIGSRDLELAAFLFESGNEQKAEKIFTENPSKMPPSGEFLPGYLNPDFHFIFDWLYNRDDEKRIHRYKHELLQLDGNLYWVSHEVAGEEMKEILSFFPLTLEEAERRFNLMLPNNY